MWEVPIESGVYDNDYLWDIEPTPDDGYLLVGFNYTPMADSWVIKVDSLGQTCGIANCNSTATIIDNISSIEARGNKMSVSPNPAQNSALLAWHTPCKGILQVYDYTGKEVHKQVVGGKSTTIDLGNLPNGMYIARISSSHRQAVAIGKIIIMR